MKYCQVDDLMIAPQRYDERPKNMLSSEGMVEQKGGHNDNGREELYRTGTACWFTPFQDEKKNVAHAAQSYAKMSLHARISCGLFREKVDQESMFIHS